jgi:phosphoribosylamine--glycine ligase
MLTKDGPKLLEYNVRLGDPETQVILPRLKSGEFLRLCLAMILDKLENFELRVEPWSTCAVVVAAKGYPSNPRKGDAIYLKDNFTSDDSWVDYTGIDKYGNLLYTSAGRVATIVARGYTPERACSLAYDGVKQIQFSGMQYRKDIGKNILED